MACKCFRGYLSCGVTEIIVKTGIAEIAEYTLVITSHQGSKYTLDVGSDVFGDITVPVTDFPDGFFNPYAGVFTLQLTAGCDVVMFCDEYSCYEFEVVNGNSTKNTLTCCQSENPDIMPCCTTDSYPFTNEAVTTINYYGTRPSVEVAYLNEDDTWTLAGIMTTITFNGTTITVDHGGLASGVVKLSR